MKIVSMTSICVDRYNNSTLIYPGGESLNFAINCCRYDYMDVHLIGAIGNDLYGKKVLESLHGKIIHIDCVHVQNGITANNLTFLTENGDRYYKEDSWTGGVYQDFSLSAQDKICMQNADIIHTSINCPVFEDILYYKDIYGYDLVVDFNNHRDFETWEPFIDKISMFFISANDSVLPVLENWSKKYSGIFIATLAERGSITYHNGKDYKVHAEPVSKVIDTTGCGDSYQAGFIAGYVLTKDIVHAMKEGTKLAAKTLSHIGGIA